jgi:hypothetical protein
MTTTQLTPAQHAILAKAINTSGGKIDWFPDNIKGGARKKVLDGLFNRALITPDGEGWCVAAEGYDALGMKRPGDPAANAEAKSMIRQRPEGRRCRRRSDDAPQQNDASRRHNSKQAEAAHPREQQAGQTVIRMLQRPEGRNHEKRSAAGTGWQAHTVRGTFAGAFKKKLGLTIVSDKPQGGERVYRIA